MRYSKMIPLIIIACLVQANAYSGNTLSENKTRVEVKKISGCTGSGINSITLKDDCSGGMCMEIKAYAEGMHGIENWHFDFSNGKTWDTVTYTSSNPDVPCPGNNGANCTSIGCGSYSMINGICTCTACTSPAAPTFTLCNIFQPFGTYTITMAVTPAHSTCLSSYIVTYTNNPTTFSVNSATLCSGKSQVLTTNSGASRFTWSTGDTTASITVSPTITTTYSVTGSYSQGCTKTGSAVVTVIQSPVAGFSLDKDTIVAGGCINLTDQSVPVAGTIISRRWYYDNTLIPGNTAPNLNYCPPSTIGDHKVCISVTNTNGCRDSICKNLYVRLATGIGNNYKGQPVKTFTFSVQNNYFIEVENKKYRDAFVEIIDMTGKKVLSGNLKTGKSKFDIFQLAQGFYMVRIYSGEDQQFFKLMKK